MRSNQGFTLVELMVALGIGMVVTLAGMQLFLTNQKTFNINRASVDVAANGRLAIDQITRSLRRVGYFSMETGDTGIPTLASDTYSGAVISQNSATTNVGIGNSDRLVLQYRTIEPTEVDCEGTNVVSVGAYGERITERYILASDTDNVPSLACDGNDANTTGTIIARGIESFQILLGVDGTSNRAVGVTRYMDVTTYAALVPRPPIVAVRIGLLARSEQEIGNAPAVDTSMYVLQDEIKKTDLPPADRKLRRVFVSTVQLRNADSSGV